MSSFEYLAPKIYHTYYITLVSGGKATNERVKTTFIFFKGSNLSGSDQLNIDLSSTAILLRKPLFTCKVATKDKWTDERILVMKLRVGRILIFIN